VVAHETGTAIVPRVALAPNTRTLLVIGERARAVEPHQRCTDHRGGSRLQDAAPGDGRGELLGELVKRGIFHQHYLHEVKWSEAGCSLAGM
jgi:hypothetical protein